MNESNPLNNLVNFALDSNNGVYKSALTHIIVCQCAVAASDFDRVVSSVENMRALKSSDEECARLLVDIDMIVSDKEWTFSDYKQKNLLAKISRYFEFCYENVSLNIQNAKFASLYLDFVRSRLEMEFGYSYLALARYYMAAADYELVFSIIETVINKFPDSKYEYLALCDLLEIYKMEYQSLERNNEEFGPIIEKIVQILLYILKSYSYQPRSFYTIIKFAYIVFRFERGVTSLSFYEKLSEVYNEAIYEEEIKLEFVNYYIGRAKYKDAITYLNEYENIFNKTTRRSVINLYKFECHICLKDTINAQNIYKAVDEKNYNENNEALIKLYHLTARYAVILEEAGCVRDATTVYEKIYKSVPLKKLKEDALYKLVTLNINFYFDSREKMPDEIKNIARGYCVSFMGKYPKSPKAEEIKLIYDGLNLNSGVKPEFTSVQAAAQAGAPGMQKEVSTAKKEEPAAKEKFDARERKSAVSAGIKSPVAEIKTGGSIKISGGADKTRGVERKSVVSDRPLTVKVKNQTASDAVSEMPDNKAGSLKDDSARLGSPLEKKAMKPEGFDYVKFILYSAAVAVYMYVFLMLPVTSITVFYSKMLLSYFPILMLTGLLLFSLFKKMKIFE